MHPIHLNSDPDASFRSRRRIAQRTILKTSTFVKPNIYSADVGSEKDLSDKGIATETHNANLQDAEKTSHVGGSDNSYHSDVITKQKLGP